jgi:hypothetical protein
MIDSIKPLELHYTLFVSNTLQSLCRPRVSLDLSFSHSPAAGGRRTPPCGWWKSPITVRCLPLTHQPMQPTHLQMGPLNCCRLQVAILHPTHTTLFRPLFRTAFVRRSPFTRRFSRTTLTMATDNTRGNLSTSAPALVPPGYSPFEGGANTSFSRGSRCGWWHAARVRHRHRHGRPGR